MCCMLHAARGILHKIRYGTLIVGMYMLALKVLAVVPQWYKYGDFFWISRGRKIGFFSYG